MLVLKQKSSSSHNLRTDGSFEVMNLMTENCSRSFCSYRQNDSAGLPQCLEPGYNSAKSEDLGVSSFEVDLVWCSETPFP